jgi:putative membrane protein
VSLADETGRADATRGTTRQGTHVDAHAARGRTGTHARQAPQRRGPPRADGPKPANAAPGHLIRSARFQTFKNPPARRLRTRFFFHRRYPAVLLAVFAAVWIGFAIAPVDVFDWWIENAIVLPFVVLLVATHRRFPLSHVSYTLIFTYLIIHEVGAHYRYADVPLDWRQYGFSRNHYDRVVHFSFGLFMSYPIREVFVRVVFARGIWGFYLPLDVTLSFSAVYEMVEWWATLVVAPDAGIAFVGAQGDEFDAVKDMFLAGTGAAITMTLTYILARRNNPEFHREARSAFRPEQDAPLGEAAMERWERRRGRP